MPRGTVRWITVCFSVGTLLFAGCVDLKAVHSYSASSVKDLGDFNQIKYSFKRHCEDRCLDEAIRRLEIRRSLDCPCGSYVKADSVTLAIYTRLKNYFSSLADLTDNKAITLGSDAFRTGLSSGEFAGIHVGYEQADAYSRISAILVKASTETYRRSRLTDFIAESNQSVLILLNSFKYILETNLSGETSVRKEKLYATYSDLKFQRNVKPQDKARMTEEYYRQVAELDAISVHIKAYSEALSTIAAGHQKLYESKGNITAKATTRQLNQYSAQLDGMFATLNQL